MIRFAVALMCLVPFGPAKAGPYEDATAAYGRGDYAKVLAIVVPLAERGDPRASAVLGNLYAAGLGVPQDAAVAVKWFKVAADFGIPFAQENLGEAYSMGAGVGQDYVQAAEWFTLAAKQGFASAMFNLGSAYANGKGVSTNFIEAYKWTTLALERLPTSDVEMRRIAISNRESIAANMTPNQIAEARKLVNEWKPWSPTGSK